MTEQPAQVRVHGVDVQGGVLDDDAVAAVERAVHKAVQSRVDRGVVIGVSAADIAHAVAVALPRDRAT